MYFKNFVVLGITHKDLDLEEREEFIKNKPISIMEKLKEEGKILGYVNLSTCLRVEFYLHLNRDYSYEDLLKEFPYRGIFLKASHEAVNYLFKVTCGFESVIKGEDQILAQTKKAINTAMEEHTSTSNLNVIFNKAIELGKKFRNKSQICHNALSLEAISLKFIKNQAPDLKNKRILLLGVGDLSQAIMNLLIKEGAENITITNRSYHRALELKDIYHAEVITFDNKVEASVESDIIISATSAPHYILKGEEVIPKLSRDKEYFFLDLAVPRDIEDSIGELNNVALYNLDDVWNIYYENLENRETLLNKYEYLIEEQITNLNKWFQFKYKKGIA
ncbi:glutamyl-tRNA reductase [Cetobacterium ceti]|uniref:Glutamyl-tRNA reductase n=1 Tax=Cetobacterium ceti TaxID=180163 RepID=A0A1T4PLR0_9FUSO|nr:glutamyl-tRNA reductase [Cetobacterium ceti]SJZ92524.1 glutamyl-tRNA reductase [Cetobacterium ceti]